MEISGITNSTMMQMQAQVEQVKAEGTFQAALNSAIENKDKAELRKACVAFEGYFVQMMLKEMRKSVEHSGGLFPKSQTEQIFESMLDEEIAKSVAAGRGIGLADLLERRLVWEKDYSHQNL